MVVLDFVQTETSAWLVREDRKVRELVEVAKDELVHTRVVRGTRRSGFAYTDVMHGARLLARGARRALCLGVGGGILVTQLEADGFAVDAVDASPEVLALAERWFDVRGIRMDATAMLAASPSDRYDVVFVDLFAGCEASPLLSSTAFFDEVRRVLAPGGALAVNAIGRSALRATIAVMRSFEAFALPVLSDKEEKTRTMNVDAVRSVVLLGAERLPSKLARTLDTANLPALPRVARFLESATTGR